MTERNLEEEKRFSPKDFALQCIKKSKVNRNPKEMQVFRSYGTSEEDARETILKGLGLAAIYNIKIEDVVETGDGWLAPRFTFSGAIELIGRYPKPSDDFCFEYYIHEGEDEQIIHVLYSRITSYPPGSEVKVGCQCRLVYKGVDNDR